MARAGKKLVAPAVEMVDPAVLVPYSGNSRVHEASQVAQIAASIEEFGFTVPVLADEENVLVAGHGRVLAALELGLPAVPVIRLKGLSEAQKRAYVIADNRLTELGGWNEEILAQEVLALQEAGFDTDLLGFSASEVRDILSALAAEDGESEADAVPGLPLKAFTRRGDVWLLGRHRVMCGDSTLAEDVAALASGEVVDCVWTDPPYNVDYRGKTRPILNDAMSDPRFYSFLVAAFEAMAAVMRPGAPIYVAHADTEGLNFRAAFAAAGFKLSGSLVWVKDALVLGRSDYQWRHEPILYGWKPGGRHSWFGGRKKTTVADFGEPFTQVDEETWQIALADMTLTVRGDAVLEAAQESVIRLARPKRSAEHPTMKPVALIEGMLRNSARRDSVVLDCFGGSGSTLIAAERLHMQARLMELDPRYCDVSVRRWQEYSGRKATRESDGMSFDEVAGG
jgi:DNA modification methylase